MAVGYWSGGHEFKTKNHQAAIPLTLSALEAPYDIMTDQPLWTQLSNKLG